MALNSGMTLAGKEVDELGAKTCVLGCSHHPGWTLGIVPASSLPLLLCPNHELLAPSTSVHVSLRVKATVQAAFLPAPPGRLQRLPRDATA
jgi:hypothetical protein